MQASDTKTFLEIDSLEKLCAFLDIDLNKFYKVNYHTPPEHKYFQFEIKKKSGKSRIITAPNIYLKSIQSSLNPVFHSIYKPKNCVHGFTIDKGIVSNAKQHTKKKTVVNIDLLDFFPTINFGRIRGLFLKPPFNFNKEVATALAQLCCHNNSLPQGAPTSPILSNFICKRLDNELLSFAAANRMTYTRYADDITLSTNESLLPNRVGTISNHKLMLSEEFTNFITQNGFFVNEQKVRYALKNNRQEVTGLIVNKKVNVNRSYIKNVRAIINAWEEYGTTAAAERHFSLFPSLSKSENYFRKRIIGKVSFIGMVRGKDDELYKKLYTRIKKIEPKARLSLIQKEVEATDKTTILTEGNSDWKHFKAALRRFQEQGEFLNLNLKFQEYLEDEKIGYSELIKICESLPKSDLHNTKVICIFDRDVPSIINKVTTPPKEFKNWGRNVISMLLPKPEHRNFKEICVEHLYYDQDLKTVDHNSRRLFSSEEFNPMTGISFSNEFILKNPDKAKPSIPTIIDSGVFDRNNTSCALSKNQFASYILNKSPKYSHFDISAFRRLFQKIESIIKSA